MASAIPSLGGAGDVRNTESAHPLSDAGHVREWLAAFRKLDAIQQRGQLLALLREFSGHPQYTPEVLDAVTELDQAWLPIATELQRSFRRNPAAVTDNASHFHQEMCEVSLAYAEIYAGFARAISPQTKVYGLPDIRLPQITALALFHFGKCAKFLYCNNQIPGGQHWKNLHSLYSMAADGGFAEERTLLYPNDEVMTTCTQLWLRALMLATTSGAGLTPRQFYRAEEWLQDWCERITVVSVYDEARHVYCVDIASARGPQRIAAQLKLATPLYLDTTYLYQDICGTRTRMTEDAITSSLGFYAQNPLMEYYELLERLQRIWLSAPSMKSRRSSVRTSTDSGERIEVVRSFEGILAVFTGSADNSQRIESLHVNDRSDTGYGLLLAAGAEHAAPRFRELIAARSSRTQEWQIGVIVRTSVLQSGGHSLGVHLLAQTAVLVSLAKAPPEVGSRPAIPEFVLDQTSARPEVELAFYLIGDATRNRPDSLLASVGAYAPDDRLRLTTPINTFVIRINRVIQTGEGWERTGFQVIEKQ